MEGLELELSTRYYYRVSTVDAARRSRPSNVDNATTGPVERPGAPAAVPTLTLQGPSRIDLTWTVPTVNGGGEITGYKIEYSDADADTSPRQHVAGVGGEHHENVSHLHGRRVRGRTGGR